MLVPEQQPMTIYGDSHFYSPLNSIEVVQSFLCNNNLCVGSRRDVFCDKFSEDVMYLKMDLLDFAACMMAG